jgi:trk system potassium uptake protein TrkA
MKFCVIGLGRFGYHVATRLAENGMEVLGVDSNELIVSSIKDYITQAVSISINDENSLRSIGVDEMDVVIVAVGENFAASILITALLKKRLKIPQVITRAISDIHKEILVLTGADQVILPEQETAIVLANNLSLPFTVLSRIGKQFSIAQIEAPSAFIGKTLKKIALQDHYRVTAIGIKKQEEVKLIEKEYVIAKGDQLVLAGLNRDIETVANL